MDFSALGAREHTQAEHRDVYWGYPPVSHARARESTRKQNTGTCTEATHRFGAVLVHQMDFSALGDPGCVEGFVDLDEI